MHFQGVIVSYVTEPLDNDFLPLHTRRNVRFITERIGVYQLFSDIVHTESRGLSPSTDTTLPLQLASDAPLRIDFSFTVEVAVSVFDPGHNLLICAHIWAKNV